MELQNIFTIGNITLVALVVGILLGVVMISSAVFVYLRHQLFGTAGIVLISFGTLLAGLSVWTTFQVSVSQEGIEIIAELQEIQAELNTQQMKINEQTELLAAQQTKLNQQSELITDLQTDVRVSSALLLSSDTPTIARPLTSDELERNLELLERYRLELPPLK